MSFVPLRVHSQWSLLAGVPTVSELVAHAQANDLSTLALTDTNALYGAIEFVRECRAANLRSILGVDFTFDRDHTLVLLARNLAGYANLCRLVTRLQAAPDREAALQRGLSLIDLAEHSRDLIALSDGHQAGCLDRTSSGARMSSSVWKKPRGVKHHNWLISSICKLWHYPTFVISIRSMRRAIAC